MPKGYIVAMYREVKDPKRLAAYAELAGKAIKEAGAKVLVRGGRVKALESAVEERTVVLEFPSFDAALEYFEGPSYQKALAALTCPPKIGPGKELVYLITHTPTEDPWQRRATAQSKSFSCCVKSRFTHLKARLWPGLPVRSE